MARVKYAAIDTETKPIGLRPEHYPPESVGYALKRGRKTEYLAFGHPEGNNCTKAEAKRVVKEVLREYTPVFHNADFDLEVLERDGIKVRGEYHDTMRLAFLNEPRSRDLGLKPQAEEWLGDPPEERDFLKQWIIDNVMKPRKIRKFGSWGDYMWEVPGDVMTPYAKGDVSRTLGLFSYFREEVINGGMREAYEREMQLIPIKLGMERGGIKVRMAKLRREIPAYRAVREEAAVAIQRRVGKKFDVGSAKQLADVLVEKDLLSVVVRTPKGAISTKRELLEQNCTDAKLVELLAVHSILGTYLGTFLEPWLEIGEQTGGYVYPSFNTVRQSDDITGRGKGTRTGRFSSSEPNFQNIPSNMEDSPHEKALRVIAGLLAKKGVKFIGLRDYFEPDEGCVFIRRDYNQQELRILAHFEEGKFLQMYMDDPWLDAHDAVQALVKQVTGVLYPRKHIKITNFGIIYGMGLGKLAKRLGITVEEAGVLRRAVLRAVSGIPKLQKWLRKLAKEEQPFFTWGGREYYCEDPVIVDTDDGGKEKRTFEYKMLNTLIQGSAADCTKVGMINVAQNMRHGRIVLQVHDELVLSVPREHAMDEMWRMRDAMGDVGFRVPMLSEGEVGKVSWGQMRVTDKKGNVLLRRV